MAYIDLQDESKTFLKCDL